MTPPRPLPGSGLVPDPGAPTERDTPLALVAHELKASYAFVERNFFLTRRYWGWELAFLVYSVAGALSISLIGAAAGDQRLLLTLIIGAVFWNYLSVVFSLDRRDDRRGALGGHPRVHVHGAGPALDPAAGLLPVRHGLRPRAHGGDAGRARDLLPRSSTSGSTNMATAAVFVLLGSFSFVGIGMMAAILPLLYVERGAQMTFVIQSCLLLVSGRLLPGRGAAAVDAGPLEASRRRRTSSTASGPGCSTACRSRRSCTTSSR